MSSVLHGAGPAMKSALTDHLDGHHLSRHIVFSTTSAVHLALAVRTYAYAFHTVPKDPVPSFSSSVYATDGSAKSRDEEGEEGMMRWR